MAVANVELQVNGRKAVGELNRVNAAVGKLQGAVGGLVAGFTAVQSFKFIFAKTAELETQTRSLKVLTGSLENAKNIIKELQEFGAVTPFTSAELIETSKRLKAFGVETSKLVDTTKRLGDIAGATGADLSGIATAYGQIQAKGKLQTEELLQLQERGVDLASVLKKEYGLTGEEFSKALQKGQISAEAAEFALKKLTETGGQYAGGAIAQSDTLSGKFSTLQDNVEQLARTIGEVLSPVIKGVFDQAIQALDAVNRLLASGRGGAFNRAIGGISSTITFGATSQAIDDAERFLSQVSSQKNKRGIQQNVQALTQLSNVLKRISATDPNAERLEALQGRIMQMQSRNLQALKALPKETLSDIKFPELTVGTTNVRGGRTGTGKTETEQQKRLLEMAQLAATIEQEALATQELKRQAYEDQFRSIDDRRAVLEGILRGNEQEVRNANLLRDLIREHGEGKGKILYQNELNVQQLEEQIKKQNELREAQKAAAAEMDQLYGAIGDSIKTGVVDSLTAAVEGTKSLAEVASDTLRSLANILLKFGLQTFLGGLGGGDPNNIFTKLFGGGRASGGTVKAGTSYLVGERGPELFTPGRSGSIAPNNAMGGSNIVVNVDASGSQAQGDSQRGKQLGAAIGAAVQAELIKQKRPGGLLAS